MTKKNNNSINDTALKLVNRQNKHQIGKNILKM